MSLESVIIIGGGLAGMSSAVALAEAGCRVRLFEKRPHLGGRATSYALPDGSHIDNCQHITLGCCTNLADFYSRTGASDKIRFYERYIFADERGGRAWIKPSPLPPPLHLSPALCLFSPLHWSDKAAIGRALSAIARSAGRPPGISGISMLDWLRQKRQTERAIRRFWRPVLVSALNEELERIDGQYGVDVFWKAFLSNRRGLALGIPAAPLGELYDGCRAAIERKGGEVRTRESVREIRVHDGRVDGLVFDRGSEERADAYVLAVPHDAVLELLPGEVIARELAFANLRNLRSSPITGVHLWFDRQVMREPYLTLFEHTVQWIFNKSRLSGNANGASEQYLQLVISASHDLVERSRQEIIELCRSELGEVLPESREARLVKATVVKEIAATFSPEPGSDRWRPGTQTPFAGLFLAGDWTRTGWPATMEGAVRSGYLAAEALLVAAGRPQKFLVGDLPVEGLARLWAKE